MLELRYKGSEFLHYVEFRKISTHIVELKGSFPVQTDGFTLSRIGKEDQWDYLAFTTVYKQGDGWTQFSDDGSVYIEPEPVPEPEPHVPTLEEVREAKVQEMNAAQQSIIRAGVDVTLTDGTNEHFTLTDHDQTSLMGLKTKVVEGEENIPWHTSDESVHCKFYSNADMALITDTALAYVTWHVTYFRDLRIYIRSLTTKEDVSAVVYGMEIPAEYQSEPLKAMIAAQGT